MKPQQWEVANRIFLAAVDLPKADREAFVARECAADAELRGEVERLLRGDEAAKQGSDSLLAPGAVNVRRITQDSGPRTSIDITGYEMLSELHRGGQGIVYRAVQRSTKREVAIKVLLDGRYASKSARRRFEREIDLVAHLQHPNIVAVFDSGETGDGQPFCVMDYIRGLSLDRHVRENQLPLEEVLRLFTTVCSAVNHAHQKGVIHRDIKPSNVLVAGDSTVHVLDFGLAKNMTDHVDASISLTGQIVGTLPYLSPEQARGNANQVDTRTDVYALGVILYQLLTGQYPYPMTGSVSDILKQISETPPTPPMRQWKSGVGVSRRSSKILRAGLCPIDDDVQTVILRALAKERERRYQSAGELARDVERYLAREPIDAKRDSGWYMFKVMVRRHRAQVAFAAAILLGITATTVGTTIMYTRAEGARRTAETALAEASAARLAEAKQRQVAEENEAAAKQEAERAEREAEKAQSEQQKAEKFAEFMTQTLEGVGPSVALGRDTTMLKEIMDSAAKRIVVGELSTTPDAELQLRLTIGNVYREIAEFNAAEPMLSQAIDLANRIHGNESQEWADAQSAYGHWLISMGRSAEALPYFENALALQQYLFPGDLARVAVSMTNLASCLKSQGRLTEALPRFEEALAVRQRLFPADHSEVAEAFGNLASCLVDLGRSTEALPWFQQALDMSQRLFPGDHPLVASALNNLAACLESLDRPADALPKHQDALAMRQHLFPGDHPEVVKSLFNEASCLISLGRSAEALSKHEEALAMLQRLFPGDHPAVAASLNGIGLSLRRSGRLDDALYRHEEALAMRKRLFPAGHPDVATSLNNVASCFHYLERYVDALARYEEALLMYRRLYPGDHPNIATALNNMATCLYLLTRPAEALTIYEEALSIRQRVFSGDHPDVAATLNNVGSCLSMLDRPNEALPRHEEALAMFRRVLPAEDLRICGAELGLGRALTGVGQHDEAEKYLVNVWQSVGERADFPKPLGVKVLKALIALYEARDAAEPGKGYDAQILEYRALLESLSAVPAAQPVTTARPN